MISSRYVHSCLSGIQHCVVMFDSQTNTAGNVSWLYGAAAAEGGHRCVRLQQHHQHHRQLCLFTKASIFNILRARIKTRPSSSPSSSSSSASRRDGGGEWASAVQRRPTSLSTLQAQSCQFLSSVIKSHLNGLFHVERKWNSCINFKSFFSYVFQMI